jgi:hypothetical protein
LIRAGGLLLSLTLALASAAGAQEAAPADTGGDPIADILQALPPDQSTDEAEPDPADPGPADAAAVQTAPFRPEALPAAPLATPQAIPPRQPAYPTLDRPVMIGERDRTPDRPPTPLDLGYEARIKGSASSAQGLQGAMDGGWTVRDAAGAPILALQLVDRGDYTALEGAWRKLGGSGRVGLIDQIDRTATTLTIRIEQGHGQPPAVLTLNPAGGVQWTGNLTDETGARLVTMRRN